VGFGKLLRFYRNLIIILGVDFGIFSVLFFYFVYGYYFSQLTLSKRIFFVRMFIILFCYLSVLQQFSKKNDKRPAVVFAEMVEVKAEPQNQHLML
jgi:hypothetical protein